MGDWTVADSAALYGVDHWGAGFMAVNERGHLVVQPGGPDGPSVDLKDLADSLAKRQIGFPILLRFPGLLRLRISALAGAFHRAIAEYKYAGQYRGVFPIKVNQNRYVVEDIVRFSRPFHMGLEAGSKPELLVVAALMKDPEALIVCNGYKDRGYIEIAMMAQALGRRTVIVIEKPSEIHTVLAVAKETGLRPMLGVRAKLASRGQGRWDTSTGDKAKFGLTIGEICDLVETLRGKEMLDCLQLLHFHIGSQIPSIRPIKEALREGTRIYTELVKLGAPLGYFDVGGGLGVDYDGSKTHFGSSVNYTVQDYAYDVVSAIHAACEEADVPHPHLVTESGRAMVAHHAALIFDVVGVHEHPVGGGAVMVSEEDDEELWKLKEALEGVSEEGGVLRSWHDAQEARERLLDKFNLGILGLAERARGERLYWQVVHAVAAAAQGSQYVPDELNGLSRALADTYFCNFSLFQSAPDAWAIDQLFPVLPIHRLDEAPTRNGVLADLTCDSDGKLDRFIDRRKIKDVLELHPVGEEPYVLGLFLLGAYQEILGDLHNLFGDTNSVHVLVDRSGAVRLEHVVEGDSVTDVLNYVQYSRKDLVRRLRESCERALEADGLTYEESARLMRLFQLGLEGYTYLE